MEFVFPRKKQDTGRYCFGVEDTLKGLEMGAVETLICWENLDIQRYVLKNHASGEEKILHLTSEQEKDKTHFTDKGRTESLMLVYTQLERPTGKVLNVMINLFRHAY